MFVCVEIDSEDITIWKKIDESMAEIGFTHCVWGVSGTVPTVSPIPSNVFHCADVCEQVQKVAALVGKIIQRFWTGRYSLIAIEHAKWSQADGGDNALVISGNQVNEEITSREE